MNEPAGRRLARNSSLSFLSKGIEAVGSLAATFIVARYLGRAGYGVYAEIISLVMLLWPLVDMGLDQLVVREIASKREPIPILFGTATVMRCAAAAAVAVILFAWMILTGVSGFRLNAILIVMGHILIIRQVSNLVCRAVFLGVERVERDVIVTSLAQIVRVCGLIVVSERDLGFFAVLAVPILAESLQTIAGLLLARIFLPLAQIRYNTLLARRLIREAWPLAVRIILVTSFFHVDNVILARFLPADELGLFAAPFRLITGLVIVTVPTLWAFLPSMTRSSGPELMRKAAPLAASLAAVGGLIISIPAPFVIRISLGSDFLSPVSVATLRLLSVLPVLHAIAYLMELELLTRNRQVLALYAAAPALVIKIGMDIALVTVMGPLVGAVSSLVADAVRLLILSRWAGRHWLVRSLLPVGLIIAVIAYLMVRAGA